MTDIIEDASGPITRSFALDDLVVRSDGDGRTVDAYMSVFDQPAEITDQYGHYNEIIGRQAFNGVIGRGVSPLVIFNHGRDIYGNRNQKWADPVAVHRSMIPDGRGVRVESWYMRTPASDDALEMVRAGAVTGYSFSGRPNVQRDKRIPPSGDSGIPTIIRQDFSTLVEYGPAIIRSYDGAKVLAVRSQSVDEFDPQAWSELVDTLTPDHLSEVVPLLRSRFPDLTDLIGSLEESSGDGDPAAADPADASEFNFHRRRMAARIKGIIT
jgi:phage head maturation protease